MLPSQCFDPHGRSLKPGEILMLAVFWQALWDLRIPTRRLDALDYFLRPTLLTANMLRGYDCERVCEHFGWSVEEVRRVVRTGHLHVLPGLQGGSGRPKPRVTRDFRGVRRQRLGLG